MPIRSYRLELLLLQHSQQFGLSFERQFRNFVQEQRASVGVFESSDAPFRGAGERSLHMSEQFAFHQPRRNGRAVHFHQRPVAPGTKIVNRPGHQFFTRSGLSVDENRGRRGCHQLNSLGQLAELGAGADHFAQIVLGSDFIQQVRVILLQLGLQRGELLQMTL